MCCEDAVNIDVARSVAANVYGCMLVGSACRDVNGPSVRYVRVK